ncbi:cytochrome P450 71AP13-like [Typha angustifolia]|uniref:cytochrome P450 71AP13-like n=1 Tax=Typha angustifolia TaxID=59011 RepID=UPI003C307957
MDAPAPIQWLNSTMPFSLLPCTLILIVIIQLFLSSLYLHKKRNPNLPPGPPPLPFIGNLHQIGRLPHLSLCRLAAAYGPIIHLTLGFIPTVVVSCPRTAREVLRTHDLALCSRPRIYAARRLFYNCTDVAFAPYGPYWRHVRKLCILELLSLKRVESCAPARAAEVSRMVESVKASANLVNLTKIFVLYANGVLCRAAFGREFLEGGEYERHGFEEMLEDYQVLLGGFSLGDFYPGMEWLSKVSGTERKLEKTFKRFDKLLDEILEEHMEKRRRKREGGGEEEEGEEKDLVDVLLDVKEGEGLEMPLTLDNVKAVILDMFAAGTDTTFITLDWGMTELLMNPTAMKRAQDEVRSIVGGGRTTVAETDLHRMHYLQAVVKEIFRLHPPVPVLLPRESMEPVTLHGYEVPANTRIYVNAWAIGRDPVTWENPEKFEPERFLGSNIDYKGQDFELIPFGAGRRGCPAITFGTVSIEIALAQLLYSFDWKLPPGVKAEDLDMTEVFGITMHRTEQLVVVAEPYNI